MDYFDARSKVIKAIHKAFNEANITIPFPIRTLDFGIKGGQTLSKALENRSAGWNQIHHRSVITNV
ncbi:MAG: hypothetical protein AAGH79_04010 [Bacteroidota bacterium]